MALRRGPVRQRSVSGRPPRELAPDEYPGGDGKPMAETPLHRDVMIALILMLKAFCAGRADAYVSGNMMLYFERNNRRAWVSPDVQVTLGVPATPERRVYFLWEEGRPPTCVIEVTSRSTRRHDLVRKRELYARLGVAEYFLFDPLAEYLRPQLQGFRLVAGAYEPIPPRLRDGALVSDALGLVLVVMAGQVRLFDRATGVLIPTPDERAQQAEQRELAQQLRAQQAERQAEALALALATERARVAELEQRLRGGDEQG